MSSAEIRQYLQLTVDLIKVLAWPAIVAVVIWKFGDALMLALSRSKETVLKLPWGELRLTASEAVDAVSDVFQEIDAILRDHLTVQEKRTLYKIIHSPESLTVESLFPGFRRDTPEHKILRALRGVYLIRPVKHGRWLADKQIEVTSFGRLVARHRGEVLAAAAQLPETATVSSKAESA